ncbi:phosphate ABC transporter ATP-binding protein PstB [Methanothermococcus sp.]|uniref:phosphate ABC transporter ATP-binding protein PstB n=1 Tax=Methanothermococcus sp. TaxID=2614238 RepID=UPI0025D96036|nr:phosphate ABC transporter ATP-binding protein PstB [Methanothermococcus sp.]
MESIKMETNNLNLWYGDKQALYDINLPVYKNKITALIGPSGCGKSTFLRCLNRLNDLITTVKIDGNVMLDGRNIYDEDVDVYDLRKRVGMVFQKPNPFAMSIYDNITFGPKIHGIKNKTELDKIVKWALKKAALWDEVKDELNKNALSLSGGQQQRLCIARTIAVKPEVILMDEPTSALDPISTLKIEDLMAELAKDYTIVVVTHNMQQASRISDYTGFFLMGKLIEFDKTEKIFLEPAHKETEDYISGRFG